ncbi:hypothetical protein DMA11_01080 [Marinilabiliaceae bacterium JC017]|nr:hypothetical protein DMA11_01080 [Marinilabiliaceae bacterium JC017]
MKQLKYIWLLFIALNYLACSEDDHVDPSGEELFPPRELSEIDLQLAEMFNPYNTIVEYRYIKNFIPTDWYYITPVKEELVVPMGKFLVEMWINPLITGSNQEFVGKSFPKMLIFVGSPAQQLDGTEVLGEAEGGTLIRFTRVNDFDRNDQGWMRRQLHTAYHEYAHIIHQTFGMPNDFRQVTPDEYTLNGWQTVSSNEAIIKGMVTPYGTSSVAEDFAELFSTYITGADEVLEHLLVDTGDVEMDKGRELIRTKLFIMKKYLKSVGFNLDAVREDLQTRLNA